MEQVVLSREEPPMLKTYKLKLGKKGQITIPKKVRDEYKIKEKDVLSLTLMSKEEMMLRKAVKKGKVDRLFEFIDTLPPIDWDKAWEEVLEDRKKEHR